jgi:integrase
MARTSSFGHLEHLPSARWRARYSGPDGKRRSATFGTKADARAWLATQQADVVRKTWKAPEAGQRTVGDYAADYFARTDLRESTQALYRGLWDRHLKDVWNEAGVAEVTPQRVRVWHAQASRTTGPTALAQSYRLLRSLLNVAVSDEVIHSNPCRIKAAGTPRPSRPARSLTTGEVLALSRAVPNRYAALVLVLAFGALRFGEATALRRQDVSPDGTLLTVERSVRYQGGRWLVGEPKTDAGRRSVALPAQVASAVVGHLGSYVAAEPEALLFGTRSGRFVNGANFGQTFGRAVDRLGLPPVRVHELRHTGATLAASTPGTTTKQLMARLGHASPVAALHYQHAVAERDADIARALDDAIASAPVLPMAAARPARKTSPRTSSLDRAAGG